MKAKYFLPTKVIFGEKSFQQLFGELKDANVAKPLVVCGKHFTSSFKFSSLEENLPVFESFTDVESNPSTQTVDRAAQVLNEKGCDAVIGIGGGSVMDAAKVVAAMKNSGKKSEDFYRRISVKEKVPFFALPTTSGSGSEVTKYSVLTLPDGSKKTLRSDKFYAKVAIIDPELTYTVPRETTAASGIDAFCQAVEAYWSRNAMPETDKFAQEAIRLAYHNLFKVVNDPDKAARYNLSLASLRAGQAFSNTGTTACHSTSYAFTKYYGLVHGFAVAITLPWFFEFYSLKSGEKCMEISNILGAKTIRQGREKLTELLRSIGAPTGLEEIGCPRSDFPKLVEMCLVNRPANPRKHTAKDIERMLNELY
ncbi:MAG TPA: iron-containing alcohol dehydrogenase [Candidatus Diapherotrites archaeon]|uniref:Iron-containing alcohol dehydrogenase n=1 Tax=Candidatus Iainarchaeum sp. TaxID=3101447 RepID=A0A7J4IVJ4_9ARCH|nr:iron-containing alcohol dehydrogenase [Candidatus Diapherotrites archaeon]